LNRQGMGLTHPVDTTRQCEEETHEQPQVAGENLTTEGHEVTCFEFKDYGRELHLTVKPHKNGCRGPQCGRRGRIVTAGGQSRSWQDIALLGLRVILWYAPKEIECPTHGRAQEEIPWAAPYSRITYRSEWRICRLCQSMTQKAAAQLLCMPASTLSDLLHRIITRVRSEHAVRGLKSLGVDEISYKTPPSRGRPPLRSETRPGRYIHPVEGSGRMLFGGLPRNKTWSRDLCEPYSGDTFGESVWENDVIRDPRPRRLV
jgi:hypothetical protein